MYINIIRTYIYIYTYMIQKHGDLPLPRWIAGLSPFLQVKDLFMCAMVKG